MTFVLQANKELQRQLELAKKESQKHLDQLTKCTAVTKDLLMREVSHGLSALILPLNAMWNTQSWTKCWNGECRFCGNDHTGATEIFEEEKEGGREGGKREKEEVVRRKMREATKSDKNVYLSGNRARTSNLPPRLLHNPLFLMFVLYLKIFIKNFPLNDIFLKWCLSLFCFVFLIAFLNFA